jgi:hypothetical protein
LDGEDDEAEQKQGDEEVDMDEGDEDGVQEGGHEGGGSASSSASDMMVAPGKPQRPTVSSGCGVLRTDLWIHDTSCAILAALPVPLVNLTR